MGGRDVEGRGVGGDEGWGGRGVGGTRGGGGEKKATKVQRL